MVHVWVMLLVPFQYHPRPSSNLIPRLPPTSFPGFLQPHSQAFLASISGFIQVNLTMQLASTLVNLCVLGARGLDIFNHIILAQKQSMTVILEHLVKDNGWSISFQWITNTHTNGLAASIWIQHTRFQPCQTARDEYTQKVLLLACVSGLGAWWTFK